MKTREAGEGVLLASAALALMLLCGSLLAKPAEATELAWRRTLGFLAEHIK